MRTVLRREYEFLKGLLDRLGVDSASLGLSPSLLVEELADGGMGSIVFHHTPELDEGRGMDRAIIEGEFHDADGTLVSFTVNVDAEGRLYELDLWKVDFSPLQKFPEPDDTVNAKLAD